MSSIIGLNGHCFQVCRVGHNNALPQSGAGLPAEVWVIIAAVIGFAILMCLAVLGTALDYELRLAKLKQDVLRLKDPLASPGSVNEDPPPASKRVSMK